MKIAFTEHRLDNGLKVILHRDTFSPIVAINIAYRVGSKDEVEGKTGFAHLFEHFMFDGSVNVPRGMFDRYCEQAGGYNNAYTNEDKTNYYMVLPANRLELGLWLESDRLLQLNLTEKGLETQKNVVSEEKLQREDNQPYGNHETHLADLCYSVHPYSHTVIGLLDDIRSATLSDVKAFHEEFYRPNNAVLTLAGDFDEDEALKLVEKYFGDIEPSTHIRRCTIREPERTEERRRVLTEDVPLPAVFLVYNICEEAHTDFIPLDMFSDILGYGESSRLHQSLVYGQGIANQAAAFLDSREHPGVFLAYAMGNPGTDPAALEAAMEAEIQSILTEGMRDGELRRIKNRIESTFYQSLQSISMRAERISHYGLFYDSPDIMNQLIGEYEAATEATVLETAKRYFHPKNRSVLQYIPSNGATFTA